MVTYKRLSLFLTQLTRSPTKAGAATNEGRPGTVCGDGTSLKNISLMTISPGT